MRVTFAFALLAAGIALAATPVPAAPVHTIELLPTLGGSSSRASGINAWGQVSGDSELPDGRRHAVLWENGAVRDLGTLGGGNSSGAAINLQGQVAGYSELPGSMVRHAVVWDSTGIRDLGTLGGASDGGNSAAYGINLRGQVTGYSELPGSTVRHAVVWENGGIRDLGTLSGSAGNSTATAAGTAAGSDNGRNSIGYAINSLGQVTGASDTGTGLTHPVLWDGGEIRDIASQGAVGGNGAGRAINDRTQVTGDTVFGIRRSHAFLWEDGTSRDLGSLGGYFSTGLAINAQGQVVGRSGTLPPPGSPVKAILWDPDSGLLDLNALLDPEDPFLLANPGLLLSEAVGINELGWIAANGSIAGEDGRPTEIALLLKPQSGSGAVQAVSVGLAAGPDAGTLRSSAVPEPATLALLALGLLGLAALRRRVPAAAA